MFGRPILACVGLLAAAVAAAWLRAESAIPQVGLSQLESGRYYAVDLSGPVRSFDLELDACSRYEVIVSSLGAAGQTYRVSLEAIPRTRVESFPAIAVTAWDKRPHRHELDISRAARNETFESRARQEAGRRSPLPDPPQADGSRGEYPSHGRANYNHSEEVRVAANQVTTERVVAGDGASAGSGRRFFLHVTADALEDERGYVPVQGMLAGEGKYARVYLDNDVPKSGLAPGLIVEIIRLLDEEIIPRSRKLLGEHADVDRDGKLAVLVTAWLGRLCGGRTSLKGFVRANDFQADVPAPFGNHADLVYLNSSVEPGTPLKTLLAHEYTHAVCFSRRLADPWRAAPLPEEEDWLNEAIAHVAENLHASDRSNSRRSNLDWSNLDWSNLDWSNLDWRIAAFLAAPQSSPLVVRDYYRAGLWRDSGCRGATYLFLRYCVDQFGERLLRDLVDSPVGGKRNLERATGIAFPELFRRWTIALARDDIASVRLHEKIGDCELAGPARIEWRPETGSCEIDLRGTATSLVILKHSGKAHAARIVVHCEAAAQLQVSIVRDAQ